MTTSLGARRRLVSQLAVAVALSAAVSAARADGSAPPSPYTACDRRQAGAACSVMLGARTVQGTCEPAQDDRLACRPSAPPPPPEALAACQAKQSGEACTLALGPLTASGTCAAADDGRLACRPDGPARPR